MTSFDERARGALLGCALGDAMGMPTEMMSRTGIAALFPDGVHTFSTTTKRDVFGRTMRAGEITDDTINTVLVAEMLIESGGVVIAQTYIDKLSAWVHDHPEKSRYVAGPNTLRALDLIAQGTSLKRAGIFGTTNGGAMKISPVGVVRDYRNLSGLVDAVEQVCLPTHNTSAAIACAAAVAAAVSYGVRGAGNLDELWDVAITAADEGFTRGYAFPTVSLPVRLRAVRELVRDSSDGEVERQLQDFYGCGVESVETAPAVFAVVSIAEGDPQRAASIAAGLGGDTDTIGAIAAAICGSLHPELISNEAVRLLADVNDIDFDGLAAGLVAVADR